MVEKFRAIKWELLNLDKETKDSRALLILSALAKEGKSAVAFNLALLMSLEINMCSLLVDTSDGEDALTYKLGMQNKVGLNDYLLGQASLSEVIYKSTMNDFYFVPMGQPTSTRSELLASGKMREFVHAVKQGLPRSYIIFDSKEMLYYADHKILTPIVDRCLLMVRSGTTLQSQVDEIVQGLDQDKLAGVILTQDLWVK